MTWILLACQNIPLDCCCYSCCCTSFPPGFSHHTLNCSAAHPALCLELDAVRAFSDHHYRCQSSLGRTENSGATPEVITSDRNTFPDSFQPLVDSKGVLTNRNLYPSIPSMGVEYLDPSKSLWTSITLQAASFLTCSTTPGYT